MPSFPTLLLAPGIQIDAGLDPADFEIIESGGPTALGSEVEVATSGFRALTHKTLTMGDGTVLMSFTYTGIDSAIFEQFGPAVRLGSDGSGRPECYAACLRWPVTSEMSLQLRRFYVGGTSSLSTSSVAGSWTDYPNGQKIWARMNTSGDTINARIWPDGTTEPGSWQLSGTNSLVNSGGGKLGIAVSNASAAATMITLNSLEVL